MIVLKSLAFSVMCGFAAASIAPTYPEPGTVWKAGHKYQITWATDTDPNWSNFRIDFMTGDNNKQKRLKNVATNLDASTVKSLNWTAPDVEPHAPIYFFMFTNEKGDHTWTTRFAITGEDNKVSPPEFSTQSNGDPIPWGEGSLVNDPTVPTATYVMTPAMSAVAENHASIQIAISGGSNTLIPSLFLLSLFFIFYLFLLL